MKLSLDNVFFKYHKAPKTVINGITYEFTSNKLALIGSSGSGKSTLIHMLNGMHKPISGTITIGDTVIDKTAKVKNLQHIRRDVAIVYQFTDLQLFAETVEDELKFAVENFGVEKEDLDGEIDNYLEVFNLPKDALKVSPFSLSGGQKKKVAIITMLLIEPKILILDEPTVGLDPQSLEEIFAAIDSLVDEGLKVIMISHDMNAVSRFCDDVLELYMGMIIFKGTINEYMKMNYLKKRELLLPTELEYATYIDDQNIIVGEMLTGSKLAMEVEAKDV